MKKPHYGWKLWLFPVWLRVFNIKGFDWRGMKKSTLWDEPFSCSQCDFEFLTTSALIKEALKNHTMDETFGYSQCEFEFLTSRALIEEAWKNAHYGWTLWLLPVWLQVFNIKCFDWRCMKKTTLWDEPFGCSQCDFEFLTTSALIKEAWKNHTTDETFGYSQCDFEFLTSKALIEEAWKKCTLWMNPMAAPSVTSSF